MVMRIFFGVGAGAIITSLLFLLMQELIKNERSPFNEAAVGNIVDFVRVEEEIVVRPTRVPPKLVIVPDELPPDLPKPSFDRIGGGVGVEIRPPDDGAVVTLPNNSGFVDGEYLPVIKVDPAYPRRAITRGIEGYVLLQFTVTRTGAVRDPMVVESAPPGIFERAAKEAALKFKYKPRVVNGTPIDVSGVLNRIAFTLRDD